MINAGYATIIESEQVYIKIMLKNKTEREK